MVSIIVAIITSVFGLVGIILTNKAGNKDMQDKVASALEVSNAVQDTKIEELTREVRMHNDFAKRIPVVETKLENMEKRISKLEDK